MKAHVAALLLALTAFALVAYKIFVAGYSLEAIVPIVAWDVRTVITFEGHDEAVRVRTFMPRDDERQVVREDAPDAPGLSETPVADVRRSEGVDGDNLRVTWSAPALSGPRAVTLAYRASCRGLRYSLPADFPIPAAAPAGLEPHLKPTRAIQAEDEEIGALLERLAPEPRLTLATLRALFDHVHAEIESVPFKGTTDALTALRLGQASCNGKSRLFVALARRAGIPARLVGGLVLTRETKRTSHQWAEAWINGAWVPFCPLNGHFAGLPATYLRLYTGDEALFVHSDNINFDYRFHIRRHLVARGTLRDAPEAPPWASARLWSLFAGIGIPLELLRVLLMLPLGATVTVIFRNVVGLRMFGTFLPALIAVAARGTGLLWGLAGFAAILLLVGAGRFLLARLSLLHTPKLAVMLTLVILAMIGLSAAAVAQGLTSLAYISLFPIAVTTLTTERIAITVEEEGWREALVVAGQTALVVSACYLVMESPALQAVFLAFPEMLLAVLALDLWLGRWMGLRLTEYRRFGALLGRAHA